MPAGGLGGAVNSQRVQGRALAVVQWARPPEALEILHESRQRMAKWKLCFSTKVCKCASLDSFTFEACVVVRVLECPENKTK